MKLNQNKIKNMNESEFIAFKENYVNHLINSMDMDCLIEIVSDSLMNSYKDYSKDQMIEEIEDQYGKDVLIDLLKGEK